MTQVAKPKQAADTQRKFKERRRFTRFVPKDGTMAVCSHALGPVLDISMGGLSCRYMHDQNNCSITDLFGVFLGSDNILIDKIKSRVVTDRIVAEKSSFLQTRLHQLSVEFVNLTSEQRAMLKDFILTKTQGAS